MVQGVIQVMVLMRVELGYRTCGMKMVLVAPLFHGTAWEANFSMIGTGAGTSIYLTRNSPFDPSEAWEAVQKHQQTQEDQYRKQAQNHLNEYHLPNIFSLFNIKNSIKSGIFEHLADVAVHAG